LIGRGRIGIGLIWDELLALPTIINDLLYWGNDRFILSLVKLFVAIGAVLDERFTEVGLA
jgi:hypothetical protein